MAEELWARRPLPEPGPEGVVLSSCEPATLADLTARRRELGEALRAGARRPDVDEGAVERLLLAYEELGSNALRHGALPVRMVLTAYDRYWLLDVSDDAVDSPPAPAEDRDPAEGGLGLHLVARVCGAHGWTTGADGRKHVWARIDHTRSEAPAEVWKAVPRPRSPDS